MIAASAARLAAEGFDQLNERLLSEKVSTALLVPIAGMATDKLVALSNDPMQIHVSHQVSQTHDLGKNLYRRLDELAARLWPPTVEAAAVQRLTVLPAPPNGETISDAGR